MRLPPQAPPGVRITAPPGIGVAGVPSLCSGYPSSLAYSLSLITRLAGSGLVYRLLYVSFFYYCSRQVPHSAGVKPNLIGYVGGVTYC